MNGRTRYIKRLLTVMASLTFFFTACDGSKSSDNFIIAPNGDNPHSDSSTVNADGDNHGYKKITAEEAKRIIDEEESYIILDVRTEQEYLESRIDGAMLIPHTDISSGAPDDLPDKYAIILVYCRSGARSAAASKELVKMGYANVFDIGGIIDWPYETVSGSL